MLDFFKFLFPNIDFSQYEKARAQKAFLPIYADKCPREVEDVHSYYCNSRDRSKRNDSSVWAQLQSFTETLSTQEMTDSLRRLALKIFETKVLKICAHMQGGGWRVFTGRQKGTEAYNKYYTHKIIDKTQSFISRAMETYALTVTCSRRDYGENRVAAWASYRQQVSRLLKNLYRKYKAEYVSVLESTKKGFPHAHIIIALPKGSFPLYKKLPNRRPIQYGFFVDTVKKFAPAKVFRLEKISGKNTQWYLVKYISKFSDTKLFDIAKTEGDIKGADRKAIDCLIYTTMTKARQFTMSQERKADRRANSLEDVADALIKEECPAPLQGPQPPAATPAPNDSSAKRWFLITRCINLPACCHSQVFYMSNYKYKKIFGEKSQTELEENPALIKRFNENAKKAGCKGCFFKFLADFMRGEDNYIINPWYFDKDLNRRRWFDYCDMNDDEDYMFRLEELVKIYCKYTYIYGWQLWYWKELATHWGINYGGREEVDYWAEDALYNARHEKPIDDVLKKMRFYKKYC